VSATESSASAVESTVGAPDAQAALEASPLGRVDDKRVAGAGIRPAGLIRQSTSVRY